MSVEGGAWSTGESRLARTGAWSEKKIEIITRARLPIQPSTPHSILHTRLI